MVLLSNFSQFCLLSQNLGRLSSAFIFLSCPLLIILYSELFENNLFELDFSISKKRVSMVKPSQKDFCMVMTYFFRDSCSFPYIKTLLK